MKNKEYHNIRCNTCNCVSHAEIASETGSFNEKPFYPDPLGDGFVCYDCKSAVTEALEDWDWADEDELDEELDDDLEDLYDE